MITLHAALELARSRTISPRNLELSVPAGTPRHWMGGDPYTSQLMNTFSLLFPPGERFFMDAVRAFRGKLTDPTLLLQVRGFLGQEALHSREHKAFNAFLVTLGIDADGIEQSVADDIVQRRSTRTPLDDLAVTCALEHFTAIMADMWLKEPTLREQAPAALRDLWTWHALEELDHKAVAFDVYRAVDGDEVTRLRWMLRITFAFVIGVSFLHIKLMKADGHFARPFAIAKSWWKFWGPRGYFTRRLPAYLRYYKRDFHPWQDDSRALIARFERELALDYAA